MTQLINAIKVALSNRRQIEKSRVEFSELFSSFFEKALSEQLTFPSSVYFNIFTLLIVHDPT